MSDYTLEEFDSNGFTVEIWQDVHYGDLDSPKDWDNLGTMICSHHKYTLGDEQFKASDYSSWDDVEKQLLIDNPDVLFWRPLFLYDHSGISMSSTPYACGWDSGQVGFIYLTHKNAEQFNTTEEMAKCLIQEVETYSAWLEGDVVGFTVTDSEGNVVDSCGGFIGDYEYCKHEAVESTRYHKEQAEREKELEYEFACRDIKTVS